MTRAAIFLAMVMSALLGGREAWAMSGTQFQELCTQGSKEACQNYVAGVRDGAQQMDPQGRPSSLFIMPPDAWCYPREQVITSDREVRTVLSWLREHPERLKETAARLISSALAESFKCGGGDTGGSDASGSEEGASDFDFLFN